MKNSLFIIADASNMIQLQKNPSELSFERAEADLIISDVTGDVQRVEGFFAEENLSDFSLTDGTVIAGADFLASYNPDMNISTTAGPATVNSSGFFQYADSAGELLGGVEGLGKLSIASENSGLARVVSEDFGDLQAGEVFSSPVSSELTSGGTDSSGGAETPEAIGGVSFYLAMGINYALNHNLDNWHEITGISPYDLSNVVVQPKGAMTLEFDESVGAYKCVFNATGTLSFTMQGESIHGYVFNEEGTIEIGIAEKEGGGNVLTVKGSPHIALVDLEVNTGTVADTVNLDATLVSLEHLGLATLSTGDGNDVVVYHHSNTQGAWDNGEWLGDSPGLRIDLGEGNNNVLVDGRNADDPMQMDTYRMNDVHVQIKAGSGNDTITMVNGSFSGFVNAGEGNNLIHVALHEDYLAGVASIGPGNLEGQSYGVQAGSGDDTLNFVVDGSSFMGSHATAHLGDGNNEVNIYGETFADMGHSNAAFFGQVTTGSGNDIINIDLSYLEHVAINAGDGDNTITINASAENDDGIFRSTSIVTGSGDDSITVTADSFWNAKTDSEGNPVATIDAGAGNDTISLNIHSSGWMGSEHAINAGSGNDLVLSEGNRENLAFDGGAGQDTLYLKLDGVVDVIKDFTANNFESVHFDFSGQTADVISLDEVFNSTMWLKGQNENMDSTVNISVNVNDIFSAGAGWTQDGDSYTKEDITFIIQTVTGS